MPVERNQKILPKKSLRLTWFIVKIS